MQYFLVPIFYTHFSPPPPCRFLFTVRYVSLFLSQAAGPPSATGITRLVAAPPFTLSSYWRPLYLPVFISVRRFVEMYVQASPSTSISLPFISAVAVSAPIFSSAFFLCESKWKLMNKRVEFIFLIHLSPSGVHTYHNCCCFWPAALP